MSEQHQQRRAEQRVLITGGAGFIGSHLAEALLRDGRHVSVIDNLSTGRFENIQRIVERSEAGAYSGSFRFAIDTITNEVVLDRLVSECDLIFHLAAAVGVQLIVDRPVHTIETNIMGTEAVLQAARRYRAKILIASSSEVYGKSNNIPFSEDDDVVLGPTCRSRWSYAASKMVDEFLALAYHHEKDLPVVIFRLFNTVGPRQTGRYGMVLPRFARQALRGEPLQVFGDGWQTRCFLHVDDAVAALIALAEQPEAIGQVFNVGATEEVTIRDVAQHIIAIADEYPDRPSRSAVSSERIVLVPYDQAYAAGFEDMRRRVPDISKIRRYTGWQPQHSLDSILRDVVADIASRDAT